SSRRRHTRSKRDWSSDVCSSDLRIVLATAVVLLLSWLGPAAGAAAAAAGDAPRGEIDIVLPDFATISVLGGMSGAALLGIGLVRSEERRVGKGWSAGWSSWGVDK